MKNNKAVVAKVKKFDNIEDITAWAKAITPDSKENALITKEEFVNYLLNLTPNLMGIKLPGLEQTSEYVYGQCVNYGYEVTFDRTVKTRYHQMLEPLMVEIVCPARGEREEVFKELTKKVIYGIGEALKHAFKEKTGEEYSQKTARGYLLHTLGEWGLLGIDENTPTVFETMSTDSLEVASYVATAVLYYAFTPKLSEKEMFPQIEFVE